jgi:AraC-like DNA-binding protein
MAWFIHTGITDLRHDYPVHEHPTWEIVLYTAGHGMIAVGGLPVVFQPGTIVCLPPHIPHREHADEGYGNRYLLFEGGLGFEHRLYVGQDPPGNPFRRTLELMYEEYCATTSDNMETVQLIFALAVRYLQRWLLADQHHPAVDQLRQLLCRGMDDPTLEIGALMAQIPLSPSHLRRLFRESTGVGPSQFLFDLRMRHAQRLLTSGVTPIKRVAAESGFDDPYYFSRAFRRATGMCPTEFIDRIEAHRKNGI